MTRQWPHTTAALKRGAREPAPIDAGSCRSVSSVQRIGGGVRRLVDDIVDLLQKKQRHWPWVYEVEWKKPGQAYQT